MTETPGTFKALVVDDNFYNRDLCKLALTQSDFEVREAENGSEALIQLNGTNYDLLVLDLAMPDIDGRDVLKQAMANNLLSPETVIVIITAHSHMAIDEVNQIADFVMYKPIDIVFFSNFLQRIKDRKSEK